MQALVYYIALPFLYLFSALPFRLLYLLSSFLYLVLYRLIGYRRKVVMTNLRNAYPGKSDGELRVLCDKFYSYLCDLFVETFKTLTISKAEMLRRCQFTPQGLALMNKLAAEQKSIMLVMGHLGNWEWAGNTFSLQCSQQLYVIYHPLANKYFDGFVYRMRSRFGTRLIAMKDTFKTMYTNRNGINATAFIADQTPQPQNAYWMMFLNQDTPVFKGPEIIGRKLNLPIVYTSVVRVKRGYYQLHAELLTDNPADMADGELTELHTRRLEQDILAQPETWLWSHRRWKHRRSTEAAQPI